MPPNISSGFGFLSGLFGLLGWSGRDLADGAPESVFVAVRAKVTRSVDELLALASAVFSSLSVWHLVSDGGRVSGSGSLCEART